MYFIYYILSVYMSNLMVQQYILVSARVIGFFHFFHFPGISFVITYTPIILKAKHTAACLPWHTL